MANDRVLCYIRDRGRVLLQLKADGRFGAGFWNGPGGKAAEGESPEEAAVREVREETGLTVRVVRLLGIYSSPHRIVYYVQELAQAFQSYYTRLQKVHDDPILPQRRHREGDWRSRWNAEKTGARLLWISALRGVIHSALDMVGVEAPERMKRTSEESEDA